MINQNDQSYFDEKMNFNFNSFFPPHYSLVNAAKKYAHLSNGTEGESLFLV